MNQSDNPNAGPDSANAAGPSATPDIAFIQAGWHADIVSQAWHGFSQRLPECGIAVNRAERFDVPGSLEIPLQAKRLAQTGRYAVIVAAGLIVDGGIYRHDFVARVVLEGIMQVQLETDTPVLSVVLTPHHFHDGPEHQRFFFEHLAVKGREAAEACAMTLGNSGRLAELAA
ncbi:MAG: 6,7-dimethyl-8-ribityllumazine synthase [Pseudomonadota bacterium]